MTPPEHRNRFTGTKVGSLSSVSGQIPIDPATGEFVLDDWGLQAARCIRNVEAIAKQVGAKLWSTVKTTVLLTDLDRFTAVNAKYATFFNSPYPAPACCEVQTLTKGAQIEIEAIISLESCPRLQYARTASPNGRGVLELTAGMARVQLRCVALRCVALRCVALRILVLENILMSSSFRMTVESFFDPCTSTISYILLDRRTRDCAIIDSVLDYDVKSGRTSTASADKLATRIREVGATVQWILETHVHADHLSGAQYLRGLLGGKVAIGSKVVEVQEIFADIFNIQSGVSLDGREFDQLLVDNDLIHVGELSVRAIQTPGHTPACMTYVVSDGEQTVAFVGDTLFAPDYA